MDSWIWKKNVLRIVDRNKQEYLEASPCVLTVERERSVGLAHYIIIIIVSSWKHNRPWLQGGSKVSGRRGILTAGCTKIGYELHVFGVLRPAVLRPSHTRCLYICMKFPFGVNTFHFCNALLFRKIEWTGFYKHTVLSMIPKQSSQTQQLLL